MYICSIINQQPNLTIMTTVQIQIITDNVITSDYTTDMVRDNVDVEQYKLSKANPSSHINFHYDDNKSFIYGMPYNDMIEEGYDMDEYETNIGYKK